MARSDSNERTFDLATVETRLRIEAGDRRWVLDRERPGFCFGRDPDNDLVVCDPFASRHHGSIAYREGRFHLTDGSRNGTVVSCGGATQLAQKCTVPLVGRGDVRLGRDDGVAFAFTTDPVGRRPAVAGTRDGRRRMAQRLSPGRRVLDGPL